MYRRFALFWFILCGLMIFLPHQSTATYATPNDLITLHTGFPNTQPHPSYFASPTVVDLNRDYNLEILTADATGCIWAFNANGQALPGFPWQSGGPCDNSPRINSSLAVGDINGDGWLEVVAGTRGSGINVGQRGKVIVWNRFGQVLWSREMAWQYINNGNFPEVMSVALADIAGDSKLEVLAGTTNEDPAASNNAPNMYAWDSNGNLLAGYPTAGQRGAGIYGAISAGDLNNDGKAEFLAGRDEIYMYAYNGQGQSLPNWPLHTFLDVTKTTWGTDKYMEFTRSAPTVADLDGDGLKESIIAGKVRDPLQNHKEMAGGLIVTQPNGVRRTGWSVGKLSGAPLGLSFTPDMQTAVADLDGDGKLEIVVTFHDGTIRAFRENGTQMWSYNYTGGQKLFASEVAIADVSGDFKLDVVFGSYSVDTIAAPYARLYALDGATGVIQPTFPVAFPSEGTAYGTGATAQKGLMAGPTIADVDGDCQVEIVAHSRAGVLYMWDTQGSARPTLQPWAMSRQNLRRDGFYTPYTPPVAPGSPPPPSSYTNHLYVPIIGTGASFCTAK